MNMQSKTPMGAEELGLTGIVLAACGVLLASMSAMNKVEEKTGTGHGSAIYATSEEIDQDSSYLQMKLDDRPIDIPVDVTYISRDGYSVIYDEQHKVPRAVWYELTAGVSHNSSRPSMKFMIDPHTRAGVTHDDYTHTGYDRGHMAPSHAIGAVHGPDAQRQTFYMSNVAPQYPQMNRVVWRNIEQHVFNVKAKRSGRVTVITGPVITEAPDTIGSGISVPTYYFKIVAEHTEQGSKLFAVLVPNTKHIRTSDPDMWADSVDTVERFTGLDFFPGMVNELEAERVTNTWIVAEVQP